VVGNLVVYQRGSSQYAYRESSQTIQDLPPQLEPVKQVHASGPTIDAIFDKWNNALSN
jgi:hypothetical protein